MRDVYSLSMQFVNYLFNRINITIYKQTTKFSIADVKLIRFTDMSKRSSLCAYFPVLSALCLKCARSVQVSFRFVSDKIVKYEVQ